MESSPVTKPANLVEIPVEDLLKVLPFRANQDVRYYLNGILIEPAERGAFLVATEGHAMAVVHSETAFADKQRILDIPDDMARACRELKSASLVSKIIIEHEKARATVSDQTGEHYIKPGNAFIDGKYPEWRRVIPTVENLRPGLHSAINSMYLAKLKRALPKHMTHYGFQFWHDVREPKERAAVARSPVMPEMIIVIMPMRLEKENVWPDWMPHEPPPKVEASVATESVA